MHSFLKGSYSVQKNQVRSGVLSQRRVERELVRVLPGICCVRAIKFSFSHFL